ncbi:sugar (and other) transporter family protein [Paraburkholderia xenovorans LB400]|uniref:Major facilitator superfamily (MFS) aromatic acid/H+ symporter n=1 Tax=Paraburkholderia xenovorans (strain LB400) TaxID=266265 RepID=Q13G90_PARXL|nr:aromatic acid/H+ symport family MFS transporter [Paraburkholderia xenovorans]ABE36899.1 major facilitator superfamily (MFS) aromatic acid/H+ symporter [Paraburkholderia xenovorans LB400]AIP34065.1 sugar (and other) transporter family protein [Paraburkholderia xenovorans LB400]
MQEAASQSVDEFIDSQPVSGYQRSIIFFCFLVVALDGFDSACIGFVGPAIRAHWQLTVAALSPVFGAGLFGTMAGGILLGPVADRYGRKTVLVASVALFGLASVVSAFSPDIHFLAFMRFVTGIGLGGAMPNSITLTSEYCPGAKRSGYVTLMFCGFTIGASAGGLLTAEIVGTVGWQGILVAGGVLPLLLVPFLMGFLPESIRYLLLIDRAKSYVRVASIASRVAAPGVTVPRLRADEKVRRSPVKALFEKGVVTGTLLIWTIFFSSLLIIYLLTSWMPVLLSSAGIPLESAALISMMHQVGAALGCIWLGRQMDRFNPHRVLAWSYFVAIPIIVLCAFSGSHKALLVLSVFALGFLISGGNIGAYALVSGYYPTSSRSTGVSWANAVGRVGAALGSMAGGLMMAAGLRLQEIILVLAIPAAVATGCLCLLGIIRSHRKAGPVGEPVHSLH